jgi:hypothetical protein
MRIYMKGFNEPVVSGAVTFKILLSQAWACRLTQILLSLI